MGSKGERHEENISSYQKRKRGQSTSFSQSCFLRFVFGMAGGSPLKSGFFSIGYSARSWLRIWSGFQRLETGGDIPGSGDPPAAGWFDETSLLCMNATVSEYL